MPAAPGARTRKERSSQRLGGAKRGRLVANERAHHARLAIRGSLCGSNSGHRLHHRIVDLAVRIRPRSAESGDREIDEVLAFAPHIVVADPHALRRPGTKVLHDRIAARSETTQDRHAIGLLQIENDAALVPIHGREHGGNAAMLRTQMARHVANFRWLDLDHLCALVGQHPGRHRPGDDR